VDKSRYRDSKITIRSYLTYESEERVNHILYWLGTCAQYSILKPNSWMYNFVEVSGHHFERPQTWGFGIQCLHYKPVAYIPLWWKNQPWLVRVGGARPCTPFTLFTITYKVALYAPAERADRYIPPISSLPYMYSVEVSVNSKEENSWEFCPNYVPEFGLCTFFIDE
jgi:hypothetical protein